MKSKNIEEPLSDWALRDWVVYANKYGIGIWVTLQIGGWLVSGATTSGGNFLRNLGESLLEAAINTGNKYKELGEMLKNMYEKQAQKLYPKIAPEESNSSEEKQSTSEPAFIHLENVAIWTGSQISPIRVNYWRGKLSSVDGWVIGRMSEN